MKIGVLDIQGAVREHVTSLEKCGVEVIGVKRCDQFVDLDGLVIPGGESTTIGKLIMRFNLEPAITHHVKQGKPVFGTCAGLILLAGQVEGSDQYLLQKLDVIVARNAFGRQQESFETQLHITALGSKPFHAVFIRAPLIKKYGNAVEVLATCNGEVVAARQDNILVSSFHPELTDDIRMHSFFVDMVKQHKEASSMQEIAS